MPLQPMKSRTKNLGKHNGGSVNAERWKNKLKNRCLSSLKDKRKQKLQNLRTQDIGRLIREEIEKEEQENMAQGILSPQDRVDFLQTLEDFLYREQLESECQEYEDSVQYEKQIGFGTTAPCVICKKNQLQTSPLGIYCICGFAIPFQNGLTSLEEFRTVISRYVNNHSIECKGIAEFAYPESNSGKRLLSFSCPECLVVDILG